MDSSLRTQSWYWGGVDKATVSQAMINQPDGTFMVRDASAPGEFTLTIRFHGQTKLVRIHVVSGRCGFTPESLTHSSIVELVTFHKTCSLKVYNDQLDTALAYPLPRRHLQSPIPSVVEPKRSPPVRQKQCDTSTSGSSIDSHAPSTSSAAEIRRSRPSADVDSEWDLRLGLERLRISQTAVDRSARLFDAVHAESQRAETLHHAHTKSLADLEKKMGKLQEIIETQALVIAEEPASKKVQAMTSNRTLLEKSVVKLTSERNTIAAQRTKLLDVIEQLREESSQAKNRLVVGQEVRKRAYRDLHEKNVSRVKLAATTSNATEMLQKESMQVSQLLADLTLPWDPVQYLVNDCSKDSAAGLILRARTRAAHDKRSTDGIFLIRPSASQSNKLVLSVLNGERVSHCLIEQNELGWGFENGGLYFVTIGDFVRYYAHASLDEHNKDIRTTLTLPALPM